MRTQQFKPLVLITIPLVIVSLLFVTQIYKSKGNPASVQKAFRVVDSSPSHQEVFAASPINIVINTDVALKSGQLTIKNGIQSFQLPTNVSENKTTIRGLIEKPLLSGSYQVSYRLEYASSDIEIDSKNRLGQFSFTIDENNKSEYKDLTNQKEVTINMQALKFDQPKIIISPNTEVTWINREEDLHFVNTDPHPSHTFHLEQNSLEIKQGEKYTYTFTAKGEYPYHCSAHYPEGMTGRIIVQ